MKLQLVYTNEHSHVQTILVNRRDPISTIVCTNNSHYFHMRILPSLPRRVRRQRLIIQVPFPIPHSRISSARQVCELNSAGLGHRVPTSPPPKRQPPPISLPNHTNNHSNSHLHTRRETSVFLGRRLTRVLADVVSAVSLNCTSSGLQLRGRDELMYILSKSRW
jgi:hypothetical protein